MTPDPVLPLNNMTFDAPRVVARACVFCGATLKAVVESRDFDDWSAGRKTMQVAFHYHDADTREHICKGMCCKCFPS